MLARLIKAITPFKASSVLLVIGKFGATIHVLHLIPEDRTTERFSLKSSFTTFHHGGATEQTRDQIGTVTLHAGDGETTANFLDDVATRVRKQWNGSLSSSSTQVQADSVEMTQLIQDVLQPATLDAIREREERDRSMNATQTHPVFIVRIIRSRTGRIQSTEPTSFPQ